MITYRNALGRPLTAVEVDANFRTLSDRIDDLSNPDEDPAPSGILEAPNDGQQYARRSGSWTVVVTAGGLADAPGDGKSYVRKDGAWAIAPAAGSGGGTGNIRHVGAWSATLSIVKCDVVEHDGMLWLARDTYYTQAPAPSFSTDGYWMPMGFPGAYTAASSTGRLRHAFSTAHRNGQADLASILNEFENRIKVLEG